MQILYDWLVPSLRHPTRTRQLGIALTFVALLALQAAAQTGAGGIIPENPPSPEPALAMSVSINLDPGNARATAIPE